MVPPSPVIFNIGGTGTSLRACTRVDESGGFEATIWVTVLFHPIWPLRRARYRLIERRRQFPGLWRLILQHLDPLPLERAEVFRTLALSYVGVPLGLFGPTTLLGLPGVLLGLPQVAAVGAVLSSLWMIPFAVGLLIWTQGQPWPQRPPAHTWAALVLELRRTASVVALATGLTFGLVGGSCGGVRVAVDLRNGLTFVQALQGGAENAAFFFVLCAILGPMVWLQTARRRLQQT